LNSGNTASLSAKDYIVLGTAAWRNGTFEDLAPTWDVTMDTENDTGELSANGRVLAYGQYDDLAGGIYAVEVDWTGTTHEGACAVVVLDLGTGGAPTANPHNPFGHPLFGPFAGPIM